jgi:magnesium-transporting ATPase (P-type)
MPKPNNQPLTPTAYLAYNLLYSIPIIGLIAMLKNASSNNPRADLRNYTRSKFIPFLIYGLLILATLILVLVIFILNGFTW